MMPARAEPPVRTVTAGRRCSTVPVMELPELSRSKTDSDDVKQPITMLNDRVLVHVPASEGERRSRAGILIPATASVARRLTWAEVAAVGRT